MNLIITHLSDIILWFCAHVIEFVVGQVLAQGFITLTASAHLARLNRHLNSVLWSCIINKVFMLSCFQLQYEVSGCQQCTATKYIYMVL